MRAKRTTKIQNELFREMLRVYRAYREKRTFESLQRYGAARARRLGIATGLFAGAPAIDRKRFRADVDSVLDQDPAPRA